MLAAYEYDQNKNYMRITRRLLRDKLDPFDIPDERLTLEIIFDEI